MVVVRKGDIALLLGFECSSCGLASEEEDKITRQFRTVSELAVTSALFWSSCGWIVIVGIVG
jgi:hypothetical protein